MWWRMSDQTPKLSLDIADQNCAYINSQAEASRLLLLDGELPGKWKIESHVHQSSMPAQEAAQL